MREIILVFLRLSLTGFGGPNAHIAMMQHELVERRRWVDGQHFLHLLAITNLLPGPNSSEMAMHLGYLRRGVAGGIVAGVCFVLPTAILVTACAIAYFHFGARPELDAVLYGIKPAVIALIAISGARLVRAATRDAIEVALALLGATVVVALPRWEIAAMAFGLLVALIRPRPRATPGPDPDPGSRSAPGPGPRSAVALLPLAAALPRSAALLWLCFRTGALLFGGGYLVVPLLHSAVVTDHRWLTEQQFLDGISITHSLPGPITTVVAFVGYRVAGVAGAFGAVAAIYLPAFIAVHAIAPWIERARRATGVAAALRGVNAVVAGTILGTALSLGGPAIPDLPAAAIFVGVAALAALRPTLNLIWPILAAAALGALAHVYR